MTEWNQILQRKEYSPKNPDEIVVNFASILAERKTKKFSISDAELEGT